MKENGLTMWNYFGLSEEGVYKDFAVLCREKIRKAEAQLEASLAAAIKDN